MTYKMRENNEYKTMEEELRTSREELRTSREKLSLAVDMARLGPWEYNLEKNLFEFGDDFYTLHGTDVAREGRFMAGDKYVREFVHPDDVSIVEAETGKTLLSTGRFFSNQLEYRIIRRDGKVRTIVMRGNVIRDGAGKIARWFGTNQDITEHKAVGEALRTCREKLSLAAELAHLGPWEYNLATNLFEFGEEFYAIYGTNVAREGSFMPWDVYIREFVHPDDIQLIRAEMDKALSVSGRNYAHHFEHRIIRRGGEVRTIAVRIKVGLNAAGRLVKCYGVNQDISDRAELHKALTESEERHNAIHNAILDALPDMVFRVDSEGTLLDYRIPDPYWRFLVRTADKYGTIGDILPGPLVQRVKEMVTLSVNLGEIKTAEHAGQIGGRICSLQIRTAAVNEKEALVIIQDKLNTIGQEVNLRPLDQLDFLGKMTSP